MLTLLFDMKYGLRQMVRNPQLAVLAVCTLALGIGLSVSLYSVAHGTLIAPLPFRDEGRVVMMYEHAPQKGTIRGNVAPANFLDWRERTSAFSHMGALRPFAATVQSGSGEPVRILSVCRLVEKKGVEVLLEALALLPAGLRWNLVHAGGGPLGQTTDILVSWQGKGVDSRESARIWVTPAHPSQ